MESEDARKRLAAIQEFTDLGAGFRIAARDLEIRGAGNLLGAEQSGHIAAVGIETYLKMLEDAVREMRGETVEEEGPSVAIDLPVPMAIPRDYVTDENLRMELYQKLASGEHDGGELLAELADRFGPPPKAIETLLEVAELKRTAESLRVQSISGRGKSLTIRLRQDSKIDPERLIELVSNEPDASFSPTGVLTLRAAGGPEMLVRRPPRPGGPGGMRRAAPALALLLAPRPGAACAPSVPPDTIARVGGGAGPLSRLRRLRGGGDRQLAGGAGERRPLPAPRPVPDRAGAAAPGPVERGLAEEGTGHREAIEALLDADPPRPPTRAELPGPLRKGGRASERCRPGCACARCSPRPGRRRRSLGPRPRAAPTSPGWPGSTRSTRAPRTAAPRECSPRATCRRPFPT